MQEENQRRTARSENDGKQIGAIDSSRPASQLDPTIFAKEEFEQQQEDQEGEEDALTQASVRISTFLNAQEQ